MQSQRIITPLRRWWWLLLISGALAAGSSILSMRSIPLTYRAVSTLIVGQTLDNPNPNSGEFFLSEQLASIYASLAMREPIQESVRSKLNLDKLPDYSVRAIPNNQLIEISVTDTSPLRAQAVANEIATQIILQSPGSAGQEEEIRAQFISSQLDFLQSRIEETQSELAALQVQMSEMVSASDLERAQETQTTLQERLLTFQTNYSTILSSSNSGAANTLRVFETAQLPDKPIGPGRPIIVMIATMLGFGLAAGGAYLVEYFDNRLKSPEEISAALDLPIIGYIPDSKQLRETSLKVKGHDPADPTSQAGLSFELLATNLTFRFGETPPRSMLVTSLKPGSGKSTVAYNLSLQLARQGQRVTLVDADLRAPDLHRRFGLEAFPGLSDAVRESIPINRVVQKTSDSRLRILTSGDEVEDCSQIFRPPEIVRILAQLKDKNDLVIIDSPPIVVSEALLLASKVEAVLLVVRPGEIDEFAANVLLGQLASSQANVLGLVVNRIPRYLVSAFGISPYHGQMRSSKNRFDRSDGHIEPIEHVPAFVDDDLEESE